MQQNTSTRVEAAGIINEVLPMEKATCLSKVSSEDRQNLRHRKASGDGVFSPDFKDLRRAEFFSGKTRLHNWSTAIVRQIPDSIRHHSEAHEYNATYGLPPVEPIDLELARKEHAEYTQTLRDLGLDVTVLPADESLPDCPFVEDTCVIVDNKALLTRPYSESRRGEADAVNRVLMGLGLEIHQVDDEEATLEGGDVFFTGHEFFVGNSTRTNIKGIEFLRKTFPEYPVHAIPLAPPELHLKGVACIAAPGVIAVCESDWGIAAWKTEHQAQAVLWDIFSPCTC
ncbi:N(G),N(G)-dimethylarginine dimethylaminohydrolase 1 [Branchiostoma belcheri]|nr:N(G),N(G)-dimethylarginine dimethylaminohydrolase 1 [Branchiostoma belcheri]